MDTIHLFEKAGLGKAPFFFVDFYVRPGGCDYCGQYIVNTCVIRDINGKVFKVGTTCVFKTGDAGMVKIVNEKLATLRRIQSGNRIRFAKKCLYHNQALRDVLKTIPHPMLHGLTMLDYCEYFLSHSCIDVDNETYVGSAGELRAAKQVEKALKII